MLVTSTPVFTIIDSVHRMPVSLVLLLTRDVVVVY